MTKGLLWLQLIAFLLPFGLRLFITKDPLRFGLDFWPFIIAWLAGVVAFFAGVGARKKRWIKWYLWLYLIFFVLTFPFIFFSLGWINYVEVDHGEYSTSSSGSTGLATFYENHGLYATPVISVREMSKDADFKHYKKQGVVILTDNKEDYILTKFVLSQQFMPNSKEYQEQLSFIEDNIQRLRKEHNKGDYKIIVAERTDLVITYKDGRLISYSWPENNDKTGLEINKDSTTVKYILSRYDADKRRDVDTTYSANMPIVSLPSLYFLLTHKQFNKQLIKFVTDKGKKTVSYN